jgi:hypothetical protein
VFLDHVKARLAERAPTLLEGVTGCNAEEVALLEQQLGLALPSAYREFLLWMGHGSDRLFRGSLCFYDDLIYMQEQAANLVAREARPGTLPEGTLVILMHEGYEIDFLSGFEGDNPPVYFFSAGSGRETWIRTHDSYSDYLISRLTEQAALIRFADEIDADRDQRHD